MTDTLQDRLRAEATGTSWNDIPADFRPVLHDAADALDAAEAEITRLRRERNAAKDAERRWRGDAIKANSDALKAEKEAQAAEAALAQARLEGVAEGLREAIAACDEHAAFFQTLAMRHPEDSEQRGRCWARAWAINVVRAAIEARQTIPSRAPGAGSPTTAPVEPFHTDKQAAVGSEPPAPPPLEAQQDAVAALVEAAWAEIEAFCVIEHSGQQAARERLEAALARLAGEGR